MKNTADSALLKTPEGPQKYADAVTFALTSHPRFGGLQLQRRHGACNLTALEHPAAAAD
jgi:hypothetical protein